MRKEFYIEEILNKTLKDFIEKHYPDGHRFMQDNDPKHTSRMAQNLWKRAASGPKHQQSRQTWTQ